MKHNKKLSYVNGSGADNLTVRFAEDMGNKSYTVKNCMGEVLAIGEVRATGILDFDVPRAGILTIE